MTKIMVFKSNACSELNNVQMGHLPLSLRKVSFFSSPHMQVIYQETWIIIPQNAGGCGGLED